MPDETLITDAPPRVGNIFACTAAGLLSSVLTVGSMAILDPLDPFVGVIFGATIAICLSVRQRMWSAGRIVALIASSVMAYFAAIWLSILAIDLLNFLGMGVEKSPNEFSPAMFSIAGFVGAFVFVLAVLLLFFQQKGWRAPAKAAALALPGALLGLISAIASQSVQAMFAQWFTPSGDWAVKREQFYSAYLIWQTGMAFVIAALLPRAVMVFFPSKQPVPVTGAHMELSVGGKIFVACMLTGTILVGLGEGRYLYREWSRQQHVEKPQTH